LIFVDFRRELRNNQIRGEYRDMKTLKQTQSITGNWKMKLGTKQADMPVVGETVLANGQERKVAQVLQLGGLTRFILEGDPQ